ncbi:MAG: phage major capsid protein, partial [Anaerolineae bacterium]
MEHETLYEEAHALNAKAIALYEEIATGERGIEDREQADGWLKEAGEKADVAGNMKKAGELDKHLNEGIGSLTAGLTGETAEVSGALNSRLPPAGSHDNEWKSLGEFGLAVLAASDRKWERKLIDAKVITAETVDRLYAHQNEMKTLMQEGLGAAGGFLVPVPYLAELFYKAWERSIVRPRSRIIPMSTRQIQMPSLDQTITPVNQKSAFFGGVSFQWIEEGESKPELEVLFKLVTLTVHELAGYLPVTNALIEDSAISIDGLLRMLLPSAMADAEDWWFLNGNGAGVPQGVISAPATIQVARSGAGTITWTDVKGMVHAFQPGANGIWVAHICTMEQIMALQDAAGNALWLANIVSGMPAQLMGYPIFWTEKVPNLGTKGDIGLYDFSYYLIGDRRGPTLDVS